MLPGQNFSLGIFARASLGFVLSVAVASLAQARPEADASTSAKRQSAAAQYARAEEQRAALENKPAEKRTLAEYKQVVSGYHRVTLITPRAPEVPDSLLAVAQLYTEMGDRFGRSYYQSAADSYQFLAHEYPSSRYCQDAILKVAKLERDQLGDTASARKTYEDFLKRYPRSPRKREAQEALAELALLQNNEPEPAAANAAADLGGNAAPPPAEERRANAVHSGGKSVDRTESEEAPRVRRIRASAAGEATRVTIDLEDTVQYTSGRITNPDRIFFDLRAARLTPEVTRGSIHVEGNLLTAVRVAQNHAGVVRVVLDVSGVKEYTASLTSNPPQLLIDLYADFPPKASARAATAKYGPPVDNHQDAHENAAAANNAGNPKNAKSKAVKANASSASGKPDLIQPTAMPQPTRDGQSTLTRTLGLKIGRIVIDPGHGGHDTGTIGPSGLMEKDLCLDVALRLGKIIEQRLPGADVVYTRSDDTFIPLEERTNIANQAKADLFISIHANSSRDHAARGIETYYLNLKGTPEAMEVAARENATAQEGVHDLQDLVKRIAQTEKIDESKELAEDVQDSLSKRIQKPGKAMKNRGVRKAPFVVLIGADMPSILTEISFLSNAADEKMLKNPEQRQKVAEGLYQGVASYLENLNSVSVNMPGKTGAGRASAAAGVEQSRNQN